MKADREEKILMTALLNFKEKLKIIYSRYSAYINPAIKYFSMMISLFVMAHYVGYTSMLKNPVVLILIAAISAVLPLNVVVVLNTIMMVANMYSISAEIAMVVLMIFIIMYFFYFRFSSKYGYVLILMPILCFMRVPFIMPLVLGMAAAPSSIIAMIFGMVMFFMMKYGSEEVILIANGSSDSGVDKMSSFVSKLMSDKELLAFIIAFSITTLIVYGIKRLSVNYSTTIGIVAGGIFDVIVILSATYMFDIDGVFKIWMICVFSVLSIIIAYILQFFIIALDYSRTEFTQFEDDDYYYYVKAVPKVKVTATDVKVKRINVKRAK